MNRTVVKLAYLALCVPGALPAQSGSILDSLGHYFLAEMNRQHVPGLSVAILRGDRVVLARGYGFANIELHVPASDSTVYQSGSVGKQFTAAGVVMLSDQGRLRLDDPITNWFPEGAGVWDAITVRHLLTHTSGIREYADSTFDYRKDYTEEQLVRFAASRPLDFPPGERWAYSNTGYVLLGILIHRVTGQFYGDVLRDFIFRPLGMRTTRIISEADIVPNRATGYRLVDGEIKNPEWVSPSVNTTADGSLYFTINDLVKWAIALTHQQLLNHADLQAAWTPVRLNDGGTYPYGFGWMLREQRGHRRIGHSGGWQGFKTSIYRYPEFDLTVIVLANLAEANTEALAYGIAGIMEPALQPPHLLAGPLGGPTPTQPIPDLLRDIAAGTDSSRVTAGLRHFLSPTLRKNFRGLLADVTSWTLLGCDSVGSRGVSRLGVRIEHICYAQGSGAKMNTVVSLLYSADWRAAGFDVYAF